MGTMQGDGKPSENVATSALTEAISYQQQLVAMDSAGLHTHGQLVTELARTHAAVAQAEALDRIATGVEALLFEYKHTIYELGRAQR
jgi:signal recognition particle GTPase